MAQERSASAGLLVRVVVVAIAAWSLLGGLTLTLFHGSSAGALAAGIADEAGRRLVGAQMLVLVPVYLLIALRPGRYGSLLWLPFLGQAAVFLAVGYSMLSGDTDVDDGIVAFAVSGVLAGALAFAWVSRMRSGAQEQREELKRDEDESNRQDLNIEVDES